LPQQHKRADKSTLFKSLHINKFEFYLALVTAATVFLHVSAIFYFVSADLLVLTAKASAFSDST
jgi:hypothetical protein